LFEAEDLEVQVAELALDHGFVTQDAVEVVAAGELGGGGRFGDALEASGDAGPGEVGTHAGFIDGVDLETVEAAESPMGCGDTLDEELLVAVAGLDGVAEVVEQVGHVAGLFVFVPPENGVVGEQAVLEGVHARAFFAFGGSGAGAFLGVLAVGGELGGGDGRGRRKRGRRKGRR